MSVHKQIIKYEDARTSITNNTALSPESKKLSMQVIEVAAAGKRGDPPSQAKLDELVSAVVHIAGKAKSEQEGRHGQIAGNAADIASRKADAHGITGAHKDKAVAEGQGKALEKEVEILNRKLEAAEYAVKEKELEANKANAQIAIEVHNTRGAKAAAEAKEKELEEHKKTTAKEAAAKDKALKDQDKKIKSKEKELEEHIDKEKKAVEKNAGKRKETDKRAAKGPNAVKDKLITVSKEICPNAVDEEKPDGDLAPTDLRMRKMLKVNDKDGAYVAGKFEKPNKDDQAVAKHWGVAASCTLIKTLKGNDGKFPGVSGEQKDKIILDCYQKMKSVTNLRDDDESHVAKKPKTN